MRDSVLASGSEKNTNPGTDDVQSVFKEQFSSLASDKEAFHSTLRDAFGDNYDVGAAETIRQQTLTGDFSWMPSIEYVSADVLGDGIGAYDSANDRILLNNDFKGSTQLANIFTEEVGHALDARLNTSDTAGDEGELFQMLVAGNNPDATRRQEMLNDNDHGNVVVNGEAVEVEFGWNPFKDVAEFVQDEIIDPIKEHIVEPVVEHVVKPILDLGSSVIDIATDVIKFPFELGQIFFSGLGDAGSALFSGDFSGAWNALTTTAGDMFEASAAQVVDTGVMSLHAAVNFIESVTGQIEERSLSQAEINYLRPIYGDSIDYSAVTVQSGGIKESLDMRANVVGNDIFMPESAFEADGVTLTEDGLETLGHEMGHIWQFQNRGPDYISSAILSQHSHGSEGVGTGEGYDWLAVADEGVHFNDMNPESQAELASFIGQSIDPITGEVSEDLLEKAIAKELKIDSYDISSEALAIVMEAHDILRAG
ncbi:hypothetical protein [Granulosicoccus antarcticus]|uniref:hypothetical protein n=1 Tax=Granulosicoccus antarcticus TaxID=437505 RepID=UPI0012FDFA78|nr:hypothetical protein [Granulosicoccus antarcticus]